MDTHDRKDRKKENLEDKERPTTIYRNDTRRMWTSLLLLKECPVPPSNFFQLTEQVPSTLKLQF